MNSNAKKEFLDHLQTSFRNYFTPVTNTPIDQAKAKSYINGLMAAGRIFGISFDELQQILIQEQNLRTPNKTKLEIPKQELLDIPAFIRNHQKSTEKELK